MNNSLISVELNDALNSWQIVKKLIPTMKEYIDNNSNNLQILQEKELENNNGQASSTIDSNNNATRFQRFIKSRIRNSERDISAHSFDFIADSSIIQLNYLNYVQNKITQDNKLKEQEENEIMDEPKEFQNLYVTIFTDIHKFLISLMRANICTCCHSNFTILDVCYSCMYVRNAGIGMANILLFFIFNQNIKII